MNKIDKRQSDSQERKPDLLCFSHLRWDFVFQRPQHLMSRFARHRRVFFIEEMVLGGETASLLERVCPQSGVIVITPQIPASTSAGDAPQVLERLIRRLISQNDIREFVNWFYTPMAFEFASFLRPRATVYDCMDELSLFRGASPRLVELERLLMSRADLVFTGGLSLFEAKCELHPRVYAFPSSVDVAHFARARRWQDQPADQAAIPGPRIGYAGVIDERIDYELIRDVAALHPDWHLIMLGPVVKVDPGSLPTAENIHYLGMKAYEELPAYMAGWDIGMLPFAMNDSTRFISPTKTPEYLSAGLRVISTPVRDVVRTYGEIGLVRIARTAEEFSNATEELLAEHMGLKWRERVDMYLAAMSWNETWREMERLVTEISNGRPSRAGALVTQGVVANV